MEEKSTYIYGMHPVIEAVRSGRKIEKVLLRQGLEGPLARELAVLLAENDIPRQFVPSEKLFSIVRSGAHQGVVAYLAKVDYVDIEVFVNNALARSTSPLVMILDGVSDVRNLGAIARTLEVAGGQGIVVGAKGGAAINAEAIKSSAGALLRLDCCKVSNLRLAVFALRQAGFRIVAASEKASSLIYDVDLTGPLAIVMGSEGSGVSKGILELCDDQARIHQSGEIGSLNVGVAAAVVAFEAVRQRIN